jgi:glucose/mannose transport system substrate-binding protein
MMWVERSRFCGGIGWLASVTLLAACGGSVNKEQAGSGGSSSQGGATSGAGVAASNDAGRAGVTGSAGAAGANGKPAAKTGTVEIYTWWTAGGEAQALANLITNFKRTYPGDDVLNATTGGDGAAAFATLKRRLASADPPDAWQAILGADLLSYTRFAPADAPADFAPVNMVQNLDDLYASEGWADKFPPGVLSATKDDGHYSAVPISVGRINELFYNKAIFSKYHLLPPQTLADLYAIGEALQDETDADGNPIIPMVVAAGYDPPHQTWPVRFLADAILMSEPGGIAFRQAYYAGQKRFDDPLYVKAANDLNQLLVSYSNAGNENLAATGTDAHALKLQWEGAADMLHSGRAAMFLHGNWVKAYLESKADVADVDFGVVQFPAKAFVHAGDSFVMSTDAPHENATLDFLKVIGAADAQSAFNKVKGALPARMDADTSDYDTISQQEAADYRDPSVTLLPCSWDYPPSDYWLCGEAALLSLINSHDPTELVQHCKDEYALLAQ